MLQSVCGTEIFQISPLLAVYFYVLNVTRKPLDDPRVLLALSLALDRESLVRNVLRANQIAASGFIPPGIRDYPINHQIAYDPDRARQILVQAGYPGGHGFPKLNILMNTSESHRTIAEAIQQMWRDELNIDVGIQNQEWKVFLDSVDHKHYEIARSGLNGIPDPAAVLQLCRSGLICCANAPYVIGFRSVQVEAVRTGSHPSGGWSVSAFFLVVPGRRGVACRARPASRSRHGVALGPAVCPRNGTTVAL